MFIHIIRIYQLESDARYKHDIKSVIKSYTTYSNKVNKVLLLRLSSFRCLFKQKWKDCHGNLFFFLWKKIMIKKKLILFSQHLKQRSVTSWGIKIINFIVTIIVTISFFLSSWSKCQWKHHEPPFCIINFV